MSRVKAELIDGMYVVGDLAYLPDEWERLERRRAQQRAYYRDNRDRRLASQRKWRDAHPERIRELRRESARRKRAERRGARVTGSLHDLRCFGPTKATGCVCRKILVVTTPREAAA